MKYMILFSESWTETNSLYNLPVDTYKIDCSNNKVKFLPRWDNLVNLESIDCTNKSKEESDKS